MRAEPEDPAVPAALWTRCTPSLSLGVVVEVLLALTLRSSVVAAHVVDAGQTTPQTSDSLKQLSLVDLGNIEVTTSSKEPDEIRRVPAAIYVITQEHIRRSGATSLPELLRLAPGVNVARIDSDHWSVGIRGFGDQFSKSVLVMIDGRSVYTPLFAGVFWSVQDTMLEDIERIEIIRGPGGTIWGANAVNGIINVITKNAKDTQGALATVGSGNIDQAIGGVRYGSANGTDLTYRIYAKGFSRGPESHTDAQRFDDWRMGQAGFRADWSKRRDRLAVQGELYAGVHGQSVSLGSFSPPSQTIVYDPLHVSGGHLLAQWRRELEHGSDVQVQAYYDRTYIIGPQIGESRNTFDVDFLHHVTGAPRQNLLWGVGTRLSPSDLIQTIPTLNLLPQHQTDSVFSAFAQDELSIVERRLSLTIGSKFEHNNYTGFEVQPSVRLLWTPTESQSYWTAVTRAVRTPSRLEDALQLTFFLAPSPPQFLRVVGSPDFAAEKLTSYEAGHRRALTSQLYVDLSVFHNSYDRLESFGAPVVTVEASPAPAHIVIELPYVNGVMGASDGVEALADWNAARWWQLRGSYSHLRIDTRNRPGYADVNLGSTAVGTYNGSSPRHQMRVQSLLNLSNRWQLDQTYRYVSSLPARKVDAYGALDLRLGCRLSKQIEWSVAGQNLSGAHHLEFAHDPAPSVSLVRTVATALTWRR